MFIKFDQPNKMTQDMLMLVKNGNKYNLVSHIQETEQDCSNPIKNINTNSVYNSTHVSCNKKVQMIFQYNVYNTTIIKNENQEGNTKKGNSQKN